MNPASLAIVAGICLAWYKTGQLIQQIGEKWAAPALIWLPTRTTAANGSQRQPTAASRFEPAGFYTIPALWQPEVKR